MTVRKTGLGKHRGNPRTTPVVDTKASTKIAQSAANPDNKFKKAAGDVILPEESYRSVPPQKRPAGSGVVPGVVVPEETYRPAPPQQRPAGSGVRPDVYAQ